VIPRLLMLVLLATVVAEPQVRPVISRRDFTERVNMVRLAPRYTTAIRMPEAVSSVVVGDPAKFLAEHSEREPALVLVKPVVEDPVESNLLITTVRGRQVSFALRSYGSVAKDVDFVLTYKPRETFLVEESGLGTVEVPRTKTLSAVPLVPASADSGGDISRVDRESAKPERDLLKELLDRQRRASLPPLYGMRAPSLEVKGDPVHAGISEVIDEGSTVVVLFSVVNPQQQAIEILAPQIQVAGKIRTGFPFRRSRWSTSEQIPVTESRLSRRRLEPGGRADGVVVFTRPNFKQSNESIFLQVAESGAVDKPALAPIGFGVSAVRQERQR
jgi:hypothetical protein